MNFHTEIKKALALLIAFSMLLFCAACGSSAKSDQAGKADAAAEIVVPVESFSIASSTVQEEVTLNEDGMRVVSVSTVDEFLLALGSNTEITLKPGTYDLSTATDYGKNTFSDIYLWEEVFDGYQLVIHGVSDLVIRAEDAMATDILANPRYANVLAFDGCSVVTIENLTLGHSVEPGQCVGGVLYFNCMDTANVNSCRLYGCGVTGIWAVDSCYITANNTEIYNCSDNAAYVSSCYGFRLESCRIHDCPGSDAEYAGYAPLFDVFATSDFVISNCVIRNNQTYSFLHSYMGSDAKVLGTIVEENLFSGALLNCTGHAPVIAGCFFGANQLEPFAPVYADDEYDVSLHAVDLQGNDLSESDLYAMKHELIGEVIEDFDTTEDYSEPREIYASNVDEFLAGIAPNTTIYLDNGEYILSDAYGYGFGASNFYCWENCYEGWTLVIHDVENLNIFATSPVNTSILSDCISADVLSFSKCSNVTVSGFTLGHSTEGFSCTGGVVKLQVCDNFTIDYCRLFGCGILGIDASSCDSVKAKYCEIYDCSNGAVSLINTDMLELTDCYIHDCGVPTLSVSENSHVSINGNEYGAGYYTMQSSGGSEGSTMWASGGEAEDFAREICKNALKGDYDAFANKVKYPITIAGKTYKYASQLSRDLDLIIAEDFEDALKDEDFSNIVSDRHGWTIALGYIKFAQYDAELLIYEINPPSVG